LKGEQVVIIAATSQPEAIDPSLRRPGRFEREISLGVPNRVLTRSILYV